MKPSPEFDVRPVEFEFRFSPTQVVSIAGIALFVGYIVSLWSNPLAFLSWFSPETHEFRKLNLETFRWEQGAGELSHYILRYADENGDITEERVEPDDLKFNLNPEKEGAVRIDPGTFGSKYTVYIADAEPEVTEYTKIDLETWRWEDGTGEISHYVLRFANEDGDIFERSLAPNRLRFNLNPEKEGIVRVEVRPDGKEYIVYVSEGLQTDEFRKIDLETFRWDNGNGEIAYHILQYADDDGTVRTRKIDHKQLKLNLNPEKAGTVKVVHRDYAKEYIVYVSELD